MPQNTLYSAHPTPPTQPAVGNSPQEYLDILAEPAILAKLPHGVPLAAHALHHFPLHAPLTRAQVRTICTDMRVDVLEAYAVAMAWGGQNRDHFRNSVIARRLPTLLHQLRSGGSRLTDFGITQTAANHIGGLGISFYTKLLYFFRPTPDAYILDQWTAKSARLLFNPCQISLNGDLPDPDTTPAQYDWFCAQLDNFARIIWPTIAPVTGEDAEVAIFDVGRGKGEWRKYVVAHFENDAVAKAIRAGAECLTTHQDYSDGWLVIRVPTGLEIHVLSMQVRGGNALRVLLARIRELRPVRIFFPTVQGGIPLPDWFTDACHALGVDLLASDSAQGDEEGPQTPIDLPKTENTDETTMHLKNLIETKHADHRPELPAIQWQQSSKRFATSRIHNHTAQGGVFQYHVGKNGVRLDVFFSSPVDYENYIIENGNKLESANAEGNGSRSISASVKRQNGTDAELAEAAVEAFARLWTNLN